MIGCQQADDPSAVVMTEQPWGPAGVSGSTVERQEGSRAILSRAVANDGDNLPGGGVLRLSPRTPDAYAAI